MIRALALIAILFFATTAEAQNIRITYYNPWWGYWPRNPINQRPIPAFPPRANFYRGAPVFNSRPYYYYPGAYRRPIPNNPRPVLDHVPLRGKANVMPPPR